MVGGKANKRKKFHDKDKYYNLAKEQGLRSRAAFKLSQINRQYSVLDNAKVVLDLCAAPGGWTQIASRVCGAKTHIVAVDILPIRHLGRNVTTIVGDITTDKCKADITRAINAQQQAQQQSQQTPKQRPKDAGALVDVVLHDGAPNVGASYEKDAYVQIELAVHALRCATQHLKRHGTFITKIYRSRDSTSFQWVCQQLFKEVTSYKPKASRQQSAEIFYVCQGYFKPEKMDPRMLDPKHIFEYVEGDTTGAGGAAVDGGDGKKFHVFHKQWDQKKRFRDGYDTEHLDGTMRHIEPLANFVQAKGKLDAIQYLSRCTGFSFKCEECVSKNKDKKEEKRKGAAPASCQCNFYLHHPMTTSEIKACVIDLKVLNKGDFKALMMWREKMLQALEAKAAREKVDTDDDDSDDDDDDSGEENEADSEEDMDREEEEIQDEIKALRVRKLREKKKIKKKERRLMAKKRRQAALGMDLNAIDIQEQDEFFSLATLKSAKDLNRVSEVNLDQQTDEQVFGAESEDEDDEEGLPKGPEKDEETGYSYRLEKELDSGYERYLESTKDGLAKSGTKKAKRSKKLMREKLAQESHEDQELLLSTSKKIDEDTMTYAEMLQGGRNSSDDDDDSSDDDDDAEEEMPVRKAPKKRQKTSVEGNPLLPQKREDPSSVKTARWFSNPLFASMGETIEAATTENDAAEKRDKKEGTFQYDRNDQSDDDEMSNGDEEKSSGGKETKGKGLDASEVLSLIPKTDKQKRHELRMKALARDERRQARKAKRLGESERDFDLAPAEHADDNEDEDSVDQLAGISDAKKQQLRDAKQLIKAGMGKATGDAAEDRRGFEVVEQDRPLPVVDDRKFDSDNEDYDSDDNARTMALGTMMLRRSKAKTLVDASYNRYAWNDPGDLPEWFVDDENRHYRPQLPIPPALLEKMKEKMIALSTKPIAKVAEARARKNRKAQQKLSAAKKKAQSVSNSSDMTETMKLKAISKALRSNDGKGQGKKTVVAKKGSKAVKGAKMVDKRMKNDKRGMDRASNKKRGGKKGGLTGSKRRRNHS